MCLLQAPACVGIDVAACCTVLSYHVIGDSYYAYIGLESVCNNEAQTVKSGSCCISVGTRRQKAGGKLFSGEELHDQGKRTVAKQR